MNLLKQNGILSYITSNKWLYSNYGALTRRWILNNSNPQCIINLGPNIFDNVSVDTNRADVYFKVYSNLEKTINNQRTSVSGVDEDEEALNLIKFQNAYNMNSKIISVMAEMIDKLVNETGV